MGRRFQTIDLVYASMFAALMAVGANLTSWVPFLQVAGIPLSMAPFFCVLAGLLLGSRLGAVSMAVYALIGAAGAPVFAGFSSGLGILFGKTGGFILSYILAAYAAGKIVEWNKNPKLPVFMAAAFAGIIVIYFFGTTYMYAIINYVAGAKLSYLASWQIMAWFAVKDIVFTIFAALITPRIYHQVKKGSRQTKQRAA
ncbi:biotin transporter BioY [Metabacillus sp. KIGAM252]|uniref:Biotin transporter n=1 Tax=Metabacillus flavus TaxID=2823519 RepID=A0ABS5LIB3_9BACI|nr:biotin transporter BioY [Metabacillus flavus]MBS2970356.1 biotin transporter BioY [Metabacillus flavus]